MAFLAQAELGALQSLVKEGGPFAIAFGLLIVGGIILWKYALKPVLDSLQSMHSTAASCAASHAEASRNNLAAAEKNGVAAAMNQAAAQHTGAIAERLLDKLSEKV